MNFINQVRTPCIGVCSTGIGDSVCRGCKRFDYEVIHWNSYSPGQKSKIDARLSQLLSQVVQRRLWICDESLFMHMLKAQQIRYMEYRDSYCALYELLKAGASQIDNPLDYGFRARWGYRETPLATLRHDIEKEVYALSVAHFERYVLANASRAKCVSEALEQSK